MAFAPPGTAAPTDRVRAPTLSVKQPRGVQPGWEAVAVTVALVVVDVALDVETEVWKVVADRVVDVEGADAAAKLYRLRRLGPPHVSCVLPLQAMLQRAFPSGAIAPPLRSVLSQ